MNIDLHIHTIASGHASIALQEWNLNYWIKKLMSGKLDRLWQELPYLDKILLFNIIRIK
ncbi:hypothetical protein KAI52_02350 [Candidatus Parcubacteria bacterium]|nr:hypothetical protein [Candidatus Parcubacteria bacterium]